MSEPQADEELKDPLPGDFVLHAQDVCPHIWQIIEDAGVFGYFNLTAARRRIQVCERCREDLLGLFEKGLDAAEIPAPLKFMVGQMIERVRAQ